MLAKIDASYSSVLRGWCKEKCPGPDLKSRSGDYDV